MNQLQITTTSKKQPLFAAVCIKLFFDDFQHFHGAGLDTNAAGDALGNRAVFLMYHNLHGANFHTLTATNTFLLIDHINAGLGILGNRLMLTSLHALATLDANHRLCTGALGNDLQCAQIGMEFLIECVGASVNTSQAGHTLYIFLCNKYK